MSPEPETPRLRVDFHNADVAGRVRLNTSGCIEDIDALGFDLSVGMKVRLSDDELEADGVVEYSAEESIWVAAINWEELFSSADRAGDR